MFERLVRFYAVLLLSVAFVSTEVTVENGGYSVSVSFSQNIPSNDGEMMLENLKASLKDTSEVLYNAIGLQFSKVTLKIPSSWDTSEWNITTEGFSSRSISKTDFLVDNTNDTVFGKFPFSEQYGSCGTPGHQIIIPAAFFDEANKFPKGISLAREWLKYRYGVFDENGYFDDPLYPLYYATPGSDPNEVKITECANAKLAYNFMDQNGFNCSITDKTLLQQLDSRECKIHVDEENSEKVTSSFMYFQEDISTMQHICGRDPDHQHNSRAPNKQNALCFGQSIWEVVNTSRDFRIEEINKEHADITYVYVQETKPTVIVAWENTEKIKPKGAVILNAVNKFKIDLPYGSKFRAFPFESSISSDDTLYELNGLLDKKVMDISSDFLAKENGDIDIAIKKAVDILESSGKNASELEATFIIITGSSRSLADGSDLPDILKKLNVCVKILFFSEDASPDEIQKYASELPCGDVEEFSMSDKNETTLEELLEIMETVLPSREDDKAIETVKIGYLSKESPISVQVDDSVETATFCVFSNRQAVNFKLRLNGQEQKEGITSEKFGDIIVLSYSPTQAGNIEFSFPHDIEPMLTQVSMTSKAGKYFSGEVFVHDTSEEESTIQMPVIIYVIIRFGAYPVQNAKVLATIERPNENNIELELNDDGKGDPDITQNDGIYSRYFTSFSDKGDYTVTVTVKNNGYVTTFGADKNAGYQTCCGSYVNGDTSKLREFSKVFKTTFTARSGRPDDGYKPSRITDLKIHKVTDDKIILKWSAPGEEADSGTASRYEVKLFCEGENVINCNIHEMVRILDKPVPLNYGREQQLTIQILDRTQILSMGIIASNEKNKTSDLSNIIEIFRPTETTLVFTTTDPSITTVQASQKGEIIGGVIAGILILICIVLAIIYYFKRKSQNEKPEACDIEQNKDKHEINSTFKATDHSIKCAPVKRIESFPVLLYTHDQIKDYKDREKDPPLHKANIPPKQWKSLDVISNLRKEDGTDTKSLGSSSTVHPNGGSENNEIRHNDAS